jgi:mitogen-activated protein kinase kinase kinase kinase 4
MGDEELTNGVERLEREVHTGFAQVDVRFDRLEAAIRAENAATRRHFEVVAEGLEQKIKVVADGHIALRDDFAGLRAGQERLEAGQTRLEVRQQALEFRQGALESRQEALEFRQGALESRQEALESRQEALESRQERVETRLAAVEDGQNSLVTEVRLLTAHLLK